MASMKSRYRPSHDAKLLMLAGPLSVRNIGIKVRFILSAIISVLLVLAVLLEDQLWLATWVFAFIFLGLIGLAWFIFLTTAISKSEWKSFWFLIIALIISVGIYFSRTEYFKSQIILEARLVDDLSSISLILRENQRFEIIPHTWAGSFEKFTGRYQFADDKIIFLDEPYDSDFIPDTLTVFGDKILLHPTLTEPDTSYVRHFQVILKRDR